MYPITEMRQETWMVLATAAGTIWTATTEEKARGELLVYTDAWGRRTNMSHVSDGGRRIPWPTVLTEANLTMKKLVHREEVGIETDRDPQLVLQAYEGDPVRIPSGVGMWAKPKEVVWFKNQRVAWQHTLDSPDWTDYRLADRFTIDRNYDMEIEKVAIHDAGRYSAKFQIDQGKPFYIMDIDLQVYRLPEPKIYSSRSNPSSRRLILEPEDTRVELQCRAIGARKGTVLGWAKEGRPQPGTEVRATSPDAEITADIEAGQEDDK